MMWLPWLLVVQIHEPGRRRINLWLPLVLLWLLLLCLAPLLLPLLIIAALCLRNRPLGQTLWQMVCQGYAVFCALRGLHVDVHQGSKKVKILCL